MPSEEEKDNVSLAAETLRLRVEAGGAPVEDAHPRKLGRREEQSRHLGSSLQDLEGAPYQLESPAETPDWRADFEHITELLRLPEVGYPLLPSIEPAFIEDQTVSSRNMVA